MKIWKYLQGKLKITSFREDKRNYWWKHIECDQEANIRNKLKNAYREQKMRTNEWTTFTKV